MPQLLTAPKAHPDQTQFYRYIAQLQTVEVDFDGIPVGDLAIDVVVNEPTKKAIAHLIAGCNWLKKYTLVDYWAPMADESDAPF